MGTYITSKLLDFIKINPKPLIYLAPSKFSYPLYLANGEQLGKNKHTTTIKTFENGG
jgi:hypothetical protein